MLPYCSRQTGVRYYLQSRRLLENDSWSLFSLAQVRYEYLLSRLLITSELFRRLCSVISLLCIQLLRTFNIRHCRSEMNSPQLSRNVWGDSTKFLKFAPSPGAHLSYRNVKTFRAPRPPAGKPRLRVNTTRRSAERMPMKYEVTWTCRNMGALLCSLEHARWQITAEASLDLSIFYSHFYTPATFEWLRLAELCQTFRPLRQWTQ